MWIWLIFITFLVIYLYATQKTKKIFKKKEYGFSRPSLKYCLYLLAIYSFIPVVIIIILGNILSSQLIKFVLINKYNTALNSKIAYQSLLNSLSQLSNLPNKAAILADHYPRLSFYLSNHDLFVLDQKYSNLANLSTVAILVLALIFGIFIINKVIKSIKITTNFQKRVEKLIEKALLICSLVTIITTVAIILSLLFESIMFFNQIPIFNFLFGTKWTPENSSFDPFHSFGILPLVTGTFLIAIIAIIVALIVAIPSAIYMAEYMPPSLRVVIKPILEILAGIPTIVYGFFASLVFAPCLVKFLAIFHLAASHEAAIIAGITIGIMIIPFISSISDDIITSIPKTMKEAGLGLGSMPYEVITKILLPIALPGIAGGVLLALSRAIGETMIVVMISGLTANLTFNPLKSVTTITTQIVTLSQGDQEFGSIKTLSLFALGLALFCITLVLNLISFWVVKKFQKQV